MHFKRELIGQKPPHPLRRRAQTVLPGAPAGAVVHGVVQQGLGLAVGVQAEVQGQYVLPGPVEEGNRPAAMGAGEGDLFPLAEIGIDGRQGKAGGGEALP